MSLNSVKFPNSVKDFLSSNNNPLIISGPCSAETEHQVLSTARGLAACGVKIFRAGLWKPRTMPGCFEGAGSTALPWLARVKRETGMLTATEVATPRHVEEALGGGIDILWIGARTTANPFAMQEIADALRVYGKNVPVLVKNPVSPDLELWIGALQRILNAGICCIGAIHRGFSSFGKHKYRNIPLWQIPIELHRRYPHLTLICDPSHISGKRDYIRPLSQQALDMGFNGLMIESHCNPECALSDSKQQVTPEALADILKSLIVRDSQVSTESLSLLRQQIDSIDEEIINLLARRMQVSREIGKFKKEHSMSVVQLDRHDEIMQKRIDSATQMQMSGDFMRRLFSTIHAESVRQQIELFEKH
ncbi:MAG: bifunctional 3-deoxy-7-phosphoheptulonate synthase/chorismate mutase type II [Candidatus Amulumruptor caecigallinarius]|nr:bifunctional 3-deoxy-7-phosphoheptulonate synthase/chorismate mutase type II [Candidatus Amulumruptor caecigallinarius]